MTKQQVLGCAEQCKGMQGRSHLVKELVQDEQGRAKLLQKSRVAFEKNSPKDEFQSQSRKGAFSQKRQEFQPLGFYRYGWAWVWLSCCRHTEKRVLEPTWLRIVKAVGGHESPPDMSIKGSPSRTKAHIVAAVHCSNEQRFYTIKGTACTLRRQSWLGA